VIWFGLLGTLRVRVDDREVRVPAGKQRVLLAALLLAPRQAVSAARLSELVWDGRPPSQAGVTLRSYVKRLRQVLGPPGRARIITTTSGYRIDVADDEVDVSQFEDRVRAGIAAAQAGDWLGAAGLLDQAQALWRGIPLADIPCRALQLAEIPRLEEQRLQAIQWRIEAGLQLGHHDRVTPQLQSLTSEHPLREPFHGQLMLALYRSGRQADALAAYRRARGILVSEVGFEPGPDLQLLHQRILARDRDLLATASVELGKPARRDPAMPATSSPMPATSSPMPAHVGGDAQRTPVPRQLPPPVTSFTGRGNELAALADMLTVAGPATVITAIGGTAGVGKTALAVHWAHQVAASFPDGQLYVNLRGYDPGQPMSAADALARFLRALGVPGPDVPAEEDERAATYRSLLAGRRLLVLLDNAGTADQVRPLLPGSPGCVALVTSRDSLAGLIARDGARRLDLDLLSLADGVTLLQALIGSRVDAEPDAAAALVAWCARLPLALRVAAELVAARPAMSLASLLAELAGQQRLDLLKAGGDPRTAVREVFSWSIRHLDPVVARAFRLLGLHPGPDLDDYAAAALTGTTRQHAAQLLDQLTRAHLVQPASHGRHAMHDLLRGYACELAAESEDAGQREAVTRLLDYYLQAAAAAMDSLYPAEQHVRPAVVARGTTVAPVLVKPDRARAWLDAELTSLVAVVVHAATQGWQRHAVELAATLFRYMDPAGHLSEAVTIHGYARDAARQTGDVAAEARALANLATSELRQGDYRHAARHLEQALTLSHQIGDSGAEARALGNLGVLAFWQGRYAQAADYYEQALRLSREIGNRTGEATALTNLAGAQVRLERFDQAASNLQQALALSRETGQEDGEAYVLVNLGDVSLRQGRYDLAARYLQQGLILCRDTGDRVGEAAALAGLGDLDLRLGRYELADRHLQEALAMAREAGAHSAEADALSLLGEVSLALGHQAQARIHYNGALVLARQAGDNYLQARAHDGLARAHHADADLRQASDDWRQALALYTELGSPNADQIRVRLASIELPGVGRG
jgi:DNA-binding SARP family transcriptional activator/tetratricopeptide (TPR) repeat protein